MTTQLRHSSGNVFRDLGRSEAEAESLAIRSVLMMEIERRIRRRGLTQRAAAKVLGVSQPRVSDLVRGKIDRFSIDALVELLAKLGRRVKVTTVPRSKAA